jgi:hypothetical protein
LAEVPQLQVLTAHVSGGCTALLPALRNEPPYGPLRISQLDVTFGHHDTVAEVLAVAAALAPHESLKTLTLRGGYSARGPNALMEAATQLGVSWLQVSNCVTDARSAPALARLVQRGSLTRLDLCFPNFRSSPVQEASMLELCAVLRGCRTLTHLSVSLHPPNGVHRHTFTELLEVVAELPALSVLDLSLSRLRKRLAFGHALGALLRADLPSLRTLRVMGCQLGDKGVRPLLGGLAANTHLHYLDCERGNDLSEAFKRRRLAPALAALEARAEVLMRAQLDALRV